LTRHDAHGCCATWSRIFYQTTTPQNMQSADKRAAYALEHIAFRVGRIEQTLAKIAAALESVLPKP
jgi:hypothetical protein